MNQDTDIITTTLFLILYYLAVITLILLGGIIYTPAADTTPLLPTTGQAITSPFEIGAQLISTLPTVCLSLLLLLSPVVLLIRICIVKNKDLEDLIPSGTMPLAILAFAGILLPHITSLAAHFIAPKIGMAALLPEIALHTNIISTVTIITVAGWLAAIIWKTILTTRKTNRGEETEEP